MLDAGNYRMWVITARPFTVVRIQAVIASGSGPHDAREILIDHLRESGFSHQARYALAVYANEGYGNNASHLP